MVISNSMLPTLPVTAVDAPPHQHVPDLASCDLVMAKIFSHIDSGKTVAAISLTSKPFKRLMDTEIEHRLDRLRKAEGSLTACGSVRDVQVIIDTICDRYSIQPVTVFDESRSARLLEVARAIDFCTEFLYFRCAKMTINDISFNPNSVFSAYYENKEQELEMPSETEHVVRKFETLSLREQERVHSIGELVGEYGRLARDICSLYVRLHKTNLYHNAIHWLTTNDLVYGKELKGFIEEHVDAIMATVQVEDIFANHAHGPLGLDLLFRLGGRIVNEIFCKPEVSKETVATMMSIIDGDKKFSGEELLMDTIFPGFSELCRKKTVLNPSEEVTWVENAKRASAWLQKAHTLGIEISLYR